MIAVRGERQVATVVLPLCLGDKPSLIAGGCDDADRAAMVLARIACLFGPFSTSCGLRRASSGCADVRARNTLAEIAPTPGFRLNAKSS